MFKMAYSFFFWFHFYYFFFYHDFEMYRYMQFVIELNKQYNQWFFVRNKIQT